jgi:hypothetical protein
VMIHRAAMLDLGLKFSKALSGPNIKNILWI